MVEFHSSGSEVKRTQRGEYLPNLYLRSSLMCCAKELRWPKKGENKKDVTA